MKVRDLLYGAYERGLARQLEPDRVPRHVGVILDGNRRWAKAAGAPTSRGHRAGADKIDELLGWCEEVGVEHVTLWLLSTDNLARPTAELRPLMTIIENTVAMSIASTAAVDDAADADSPSDSSGPRSSAPIDGLAMNPSTRVVRVMPSWHAESWVESRRCEVSTERAPGSPASTARCTAGRSRATSENSAATNRAVPTVRTTPRSSSSHAVMIGPSYGEGGSFPLAGHLGTEAVHRGVDPDVTWGCKDRGMTPRGTP